MYKFYLLPALSILGIILVIRTVALSAVPQSVQPPFVDPPKAPYAQFVAGSAIVEALSENIAVATPLSGTIKQIFVKIGQKVETGTPLFSLDDRDVLASIRVRESQVAQAKVALLEAERQFAVYEAAKLGIGVSKDLYITRELAVSKARAALELANAELSAAKTTLDRMVIKAPITGEILQIKTRPGEFAAAQQLATPLMLMGDTSRFAVRVDIDENDAWRVEAGTPATAYLRGNREISTPLRFERFEPYIVPKRQLSGESTERVDTRVLQAIYSFEKGELPVYVGQLMDVFIEAKK